MPGGNWRFRSYIVIDSTNEEAKRLLKRGDVEFLVISAEHQQKGRGRRQRRWHDAPGKSLLFSVVLKDDFFPASPSLAVPLSCVMALKSLGAKGPSIKWINDLVYGQKKVGGILIEKVAYQKSSFLVVGVGMNIDYKKEELPITHGLPSTSILLEESRVWEKSEILNAILDAFLSLEKVESEEIVLHYKKHLAFLGEAVRIKSPVRYPPLKRPENEITGILEGVNGEGRLILRENGGSIALLVDGHLLPAELNNHPHPA